MILWHLAAYAGGELLRLQLTTAHPSPLSVPPHYQQSFPSYRLPQLFLKKLETELPYDPAIPLLGIHTEETRRERDTCTPMFIAAI